MSQFLSKQNPHDDFSMTLELGGLCCEIEIDKMFSERLSTQDSPKHNHSAYELQIITQGEGVLYVDQEKFSVSSGDCILMGKNVYHSLFGLNKDFHRRCLRFRFIGRRSGSDSSEENELKNLDSLLAQGLGCRIISNATELLSLSEKIVKEIETMPPFYYLLVKSHFLNIILLLMREIAPASLSELAFPIHSKDEKKILLIEKFFDNYHTNLQADDLANLLSVSSRQLSRIMKKLFHITFKQKLLEVRIEVAKDLLKDSSLSLEDIAERVGYQSAKNFSPIFKKRTGQSPKGYRLSVHAHQAGDE